MKNQLTNGVYSVGVLNPNLRVFDIVMKTEYGTSYNAYLVKGSQKTALIETAHHAFFDYYLKNVQEVVDVQDIDYLVMNHNEPDHSGSIEKLLALNPNITVVASQAGSIYLKNIVNNSNMKLQTVKDGETLSLGDKTLTFLSAPFLHWPDSMFSWLAEDQVLFCCDFLGAHYCEPQMLDRFITYPSPYFESLRGYYDAIFGPFASYVRGGLDKIKDLDIAYVCNGHGPILTNEGLLPKVKELYRAWSAPANKEKKEIPLFYCSAYGYTEMLAQEIANGIQEACPDAEVTCWDINDHPMEELGARLNQSDAFLLGSPTINRDAVPLMWQLLAHVDAVNIAKRPVGLFGSYGWSGEALPSLQKRLESLKCNLLEEPFRVIFRPSKQDLDSAKAFGKTFGAALA